MIKLCYNYAIAETGRMLDEDSLPVVAASLFSGRKKHLKREFKPSRLPFAYARKALRAYAKHLTRLRKMEELENQMCSSTLQELSDLR